MGSWRGVIRILGGKLEGGHPDFRWEVGWGHPDVRWEVGWGHPDVRWEVGACHPDVRLEVGASHPDAEDRQVVPRMILCSLLCVGLSRIILFLGIDTYMVLYDDTAIHFPCRLCRAT